MEGVYILCVVGGLFLIGTLCLIFDYIYNVEEDMCFNCKKQKPVSSLKEVIEEYSVITDDYDF